MRKHSQIVLTPRIVARTPRHVGVNIELQDYHDQTNLWDWVADSGITVAREFHPEVSMRKENPREGEWAGITTKAAFDDWRRGLATKTAARGGVRWDNYRFATRIPWMGVPDGIAGKLCQLGIQPLYSLGYSTKQYPRPLVKDVAFVGDVSDDMVDWAAAAAAYEYYFAVIHHYATEYAGRYFLMINEPENQLGWFHMPGEFANVDKSWWTKLSWDDASPTPLGERYFALLATQYGVMARLARLAADDVAVGLTAANEGKAAKIHLSGPTNVVWRPLWERASRYLDALDFHHYHPEAQSFAQVYPVASAVAAASGPGKNVAITEFNRYSGGTDIDLNLFSLDNSLGMADLVLRVLGLASPDSDAPLLEFIALYVLHFPSTHRNYKHLLYGDMNTLDWTGCDRPYWNRAATPDAPWYPTQAEQQVRFATPAYHMFRMLCRCVAHGPGGAACGPHPVLEVGQNNPTSAAPHDIYSELRILAVRQAHEMIITILNPSNEPASNCVVDLSLLGDAGGKYRWAVVRQTTKHDCDRVVAQTAITGPSVRVDVAAKSLTQVILTELDLGDLKPLQLREVTITPGRVMETPGLSLHQTSRLRAIATLGGREVDVTDLNVVWQGSSPDTLRVDQGGLVQRMRCTSSPETVTATTLDGKAWPTVTVAGARA